MSGYLDWEPKTPTEAVVRYADFTDELGVSESVTNATAVASVNTGNDSNPNSIFSSDPAVVDNSAGIEAVVLVSLAGGNLGALYQILVSASTNQGHIITKTAILAVKPPLT